MACEFVNKPYNDDEIDSLCHKIVLCHYASINLKALLENENLKSHEQTDDDSIEGLKFSFYSEALIGQFGAIISFFYNNDDQEILSRLNANAGQLKKLCEIRATTAHVLGMDDSLKRFDDYLKSAPNAPGLEDFDIVKEYVSKLLELRNKGEGDYLKKYLEEISKNFKGNSIKL